MALINYTKPTWVNDSIPALSAANLQALVDAVKTMADERDVNNGGQPPAPKPNNSAGEVGLVSTVVGTDGGNLVSPAAGSQYWFESYSFVTATGVPSGYTAGYWKTAVSANNATVLSGVAGNTFVGNFYRIT